MLEQGNRLPSVVFKHVDGTHWYPVAVKTKGSGRVAYNLWRNPSNLKEECIETVDEDEVRLAAAAGYGVRCAPLGRGAERSILHLGGSSVRDVLVRGKSVATAASR